MKHLAETEHAWFLKIYGVLSEPDLFPSDGEPDGKFRVGPDETVEVIREAIDGTTGH